MKTILQLSILAVFIAGCGRDDAPPASAAEATTPGLHAWTLPSGPGAAQSDLVLAPDGRLLLSWLDSQAGRRTRLQYAEFGAGGQWQGPKTIAIGASFFVNWADTPHIAATPDGALWVQWLQKSGEDGTAYDVVLATSRNDGMNWSEPLRPHTDGTTSEHGFVAMWPQGNAVLGIAMLDGRNTVASKPARPARAGAGHHGVGPMSLRSAVFGASAGTQGDTELDASVCDCCQTDAAVTAKGPLLVYRDRTAGEIRDIHAMRFDGTAWSASKPVSVDNWRMPACPVNGPSVAAQGDAVVVGWYTGAGAQPSVKLARSGDAGDTFAAPVVLDQGDAVQGRVDVAMDARNAWALWLREDANGQSLWLARHAPDLSRQIEKIEVAKLQGRGRGTGFPQLALREGRAHVVWTDVVNGVPRLQGAVFVPEE